MSFAEGVYARLGELSERDRHVLLVAAAFGRHFDWRLLSSAAEMPESEVIDALDHGVAAQLLTVEGDGIRFRHALTAEAVFESIIPPRREWLAASALAALDHAYPELPAELSEVAARVAERAGQHERAGQLHIALGEDALRRGALHTAAAALERAAQLLSAGDAQDLALERLIDTLVFAGRVAALLPPPPRSAGGPFALAAPGALEALVESAGLSAEQGFEVSTPFIYDNVAAAQRANLSAGPTRAAIKHAGLDAIREAFSAALQQFVQPDGSVRLNNVMRIVIARA